VDNVAAAYQVNSPYLERRFDSVPPANMKVMEQVDNTSHRTLTAHLMSAVQDATPAPSVEPAQIPADMDLGLTMDIWY